jgi:hypothetical protein
MVGRDEVSMSNDPRPMKGFESISIPWVDREANHRLPARIEGEACTRRCAAPSRSLTITGSDNVLSMRSGHQKVKRLIPGLRTDLELELFHHMASQLILDHCIQCRRLGWQRFVLEAERAMGSCSIRSGRIAPRTTVEKDHHIYIFICRKFHNDL